MRTEPDAGLTWADDDHLPGFVVLNGGHYDDFATKLVDSAKTKPRTIDVSALSGLEAQAPAGEEFNEHVWYSLPTMKKLADTLAADLGKVDAAGAATYTANAAAFSTKLDGLTAKLDAIKARHDGTAVPAVRRRSSMSLLTVRWWARSSE
ncbi:MAG: zinc ABC transporter substrate-binding protein, partial [Cellulomonas sp.]|nr:zinc ABC transporter substrate-binding protein [Cellulomonas sp.]